MCSAGTLAVRLKLGALPRRRHLKRADESGDRSDSPETEPSPGLDQNPQLSEALQSRLRASQRQSPVLLTAFEDNSDSEASLETGAPATEKTGTDSPTGIEDEEQQPEAVEVAAVELPTITAAQRRIKTAQYVSSSVNLKGCPAERYPEIAVVGRSNVGKSSLVNMLTGRKELALVSKTPGKTQCINHFLIDNAWYLVDLPGYGYAKRAKASRVEWGAFTQEFFKKRRTLTNVLLLVDASVPTQSLDLGCAEWLWQHKVPFSLVFTKVDKRKKRCPLPQENIDAFEAALQDLIGQLPISLVTSSAGGIGRSELLKYLTQLRQLQQAGKLEPHRT